MKALALLGLALAAPAIAQESRPPADAAKLALTQCIQHTRGILKIDEPYANQLEAKGLKFQRQPPEFLQSTRSSTYGVAQYASALSSSGEIWAVGYDGDTGGCMVVALQTDPAEMETAFAEVFGEGKKWRADRPSEGKNGEKLIKYSWNPNRTTRLVGTVSLRADNQISTVTVTRVKF